jgi:hypothetical protein
MPENKKQVVRRQGIFYSKIKGGFEAAAPLMTGNGHTFFIQVNGSAGRENVRCKKYDVRCKRNCFQAIFFTKVVMNPEQ